LAAIGFPVESATQRGADRMARVGQNLPDLPEERLIKYRLLASQAHDAARAATTPEARNAYIGMARAWETLVEEMERALDFAEREPTTILPMPDPKTLNR